MTTSEMPLTSIEICAGAGGQAAGLHRAGFKHLTLVEIDQHAAASLKKNLDIRSEWQWERDNGTRVLSMDVKTFDPAEDVRKLAPYELDLLAGGVPCPPFSVAGKQLGQDDERDLFPRMLELVAELQPKAVMIENVRGLLEPAHKFKGYRDEIEGQLTNLGYVICGWKVLEAADYGVPQLRPRAILVAIHKDHLLNEFVWPAPKTEQLSVFAALNESMERRYRLAISNSTNEEEIQRLEQKYQDWCKRASEGGVAPTLVGGSKKHGGADLGPTRAKAAWKALGVDGLGVANDEDKTVDIGRDLLAENGPKLTVEQAAIIQGFPEGWKFDGGKTARYRQVGNAFPPPVAAAVGRSIIRALGRTPAPEPDETANG
ncbi:DNA cytosine methyltransferase [Kitasatospora kazusensis]|uniref:Cytosine-specific methyltransferase n=1 Tax=Kitasatospora kazusensis TaxID=407974 RepID=A0ABP5KZ28_9ACTN